MGVPVRFSMRLSTIVRGISTASRTRHGGNVTAEPWRRAAIEDLYRAASVRLAGRIRFPRLAVLAARSFPGRTGGEDRKPPPPGLGVAAASSPLSRDC